jgi:Trk K+ transport system NAD-binding subunit
MKLIEAAIAPRSHLAHQTLQDIRFEQKFGARVLAVWRRGRSSVPARFTLSLVMACCFKARKRFDLVEEILV